MIDRRIFLWAYGYLNGLLCGYLEAERKQGHTFSILSSLNDELNTLRHLLKCNVDAVVYTPIAIKPQPQEERIHELGRVIISYLHMLVYEKHGAKADEECKERTLAVYGEDYMTEVQTFIVEGLVTLNSCKQYLRTENELIDLTISIVNKFNTGSVSTIVVGAYLEMMLTCFIYMAEYRKVAKRVVIDGTYQMRAWDYVETTQ